MKERKSSTGAIIQLIGGMKESSHNNNHSNHMSARVNMLLMHQMDATGQADGEV
jgi:hypothetical protein